MSEAITDKKIPSGYCCLFKLYPIITCSTPLLANHKLSCFPPFCQVSAGVTVTLGSDISWDKRANFLGLKLVYLTLHQSKCEIKTGLTLQSVKPTFDWKDVWVVQLK